MLAGQEEIRTGGRWMKAEEGMRHRRWVQVQGWIHSAGWETASRQNQNKEFRNTERERERRGTNQPSIPHSQQEASPLLFHTQTETSVAYFEPMTHTHTHTCLSL